MGFEMTEAQQATREQTGAGGALRRRVLAAVSCRARLSLGVLLPSAPPTVSRRGDCVPPPPGAASSLTRAAPTAGPIPRAPAPHRARQSAETGTVDGDNE